MLFLEYFVAVLHKQEVKVSSSQVALLLKFMDVSLFVAKSDETESCLGGSDVHEEHVEESFGEVLLTEQTLLLGERSQVRRELKAVYVSYCSCVLECVTLLLIEVYWVRDAEQERVHADTAVILKLCKDHGEQGLDLEVLRALSQGQRDHRLAIFKTKWHVPPLSLFLPLRLGYSHKTHQIFYSVFQQLTFQVACSVTKVSFVTSEVNNRF